MIFHRTNLKVGYGIIGFSKQAKECLDV